LDREYAIHAIDIHNITRVSTYGVDVKLTFHKIAKRGKKMDENNLYKKYGTTWKGWGVFLDMINNMLIYFVAIVISSKLT